MNLALLAKFANRQRGAGKGTHENLGFGEGPPYGTSGERRKRESHEQRQMECQVYSSTFTSPRG